MRLSFLTFFLCFFCVGILLPSVAMSQNAPVPEELLQDPSNAPAEPEMLEPNLPPIPDSQAVKKNPLPFESYDDIPTEALEDMEDFFKKCQNDPRLPTHYNCECWASRYLEERIKLGPIASRSSVIMKIDNECINIEGAANYAYQRCQQYGFVNYDGGMEPDEFCECIGNNYALLLQQERGFSLSSRKITGLYTSATLRCLTPAPGMNRILNRLDE